MPLHISYNRSSGLTNDFTPQPAVNYIQRRPESCILQTEQTTVRCTESLDNTFQNLLLGTALVVATLFLRTYGTNVLSHYAQAATAVSQAQVNQPHSSIFSPEWRITISHKDLQDNPEQVVMGVLSEKMRLFPHARRTFITFLDSESRQMSGIDAGGLSGEFISRLFANLATQASSDKTAIFKFEVSFGGYMPIAADSPSSRYHFLDETKVSELSVGQLREIAALVGVQEIDTIKERYEHYRKQIAPLDSREKEGYKILGRLIQIAYYQQIPIGPIFSESFYKVLLAFKQEELSQDFNQLPPEALLRAYRVKQQDASIEKMYHFLESTPQDLEENKEWNENLLYWIYPSGEFPAHHANLKLLRKNYGLFQSSIQEQLYRLAKQDRTLPAIHAMGSALDASCLPAFQTLGVQRLMQRVQGALSKELLIQSLTSVDSTLKNYMRKWIEQACQEQLINFVRAATGFLSLGLNQKILLNPVNGWSQVRFPLFHTCSKTVDFPLYANFAQFKEKLEAGIVNGLASGFERA